MRQKRIKSPVLWGAIAALALLVLRACGYEEAAQAASNSSAELWNLVCAFLAALGILNNPTDGGKF